MKKRLIEPFENKVNITWDNYYSKADMKVFREMEYLHVGIPPYFSGFFHKTYEKRLANIFDERSIESPYENLFFAFDHDPKQYSPNEEIVLDTMMYATNDRNSLRRSLNYRNATIFNIIGKVKILPVPRSYANYETVFILNAGISLTISEVFHEQWKYTQPQLSCSQKEVNVQVVHALPTKG